MTDIPAKRCMVISLHSAQLQKNWTPDIFSNKLKSETELFNRTVLGFSSRREKTGKSKNSLFMRQSHFTGFLKILAPFTLQYISSKFEFFTPLGEHDMIWTYELYVSTPSTVRKVPIWIATIQSKIVKIQDSTNETSNRQIDVLRAIQSGSKYSDKNNGLFAN